MPYPTLKLTNFTFEELFHTKGLSRLDQAFLQQLQQANPSHYADLLAYRQDMKSFSSLETSELLLACSLVLDEFLIGLFNIEAAASAAEARTLSHNPISAFKKYFIIRQAKKNLQKAVDLPSFITLDQWLMSEIIKSPIQTQDKELSVALLGNQYLQTPENFGAEIEKLTQWCIQAILTSEGQAQVSNWTSFHIPERIEHEKLIKFTSTQDKLGRVAAIESTLNLRDGFKLTDPRMTDREVQDEVNYCIYCHDHDGDFCSKGFPAKKGVPSLGLKKESPGCHSHRLPARRKNF